MNMAGDISCLDSNSVKKLPKLSNILEDTESLAADYEKLLRSTKFSDVLFIIGKNERHSYQAHSLVLLARCSNFEDVKSLGSPIYKENWEPEVFEKVLRYIYTGKIELSLSTTMETLKIAVELHLSNLVSKCQEYFLEQLSVENSCEFYKDAMNLFNDSDNRVKNELVKISQSFIEENAIDVVETQGFLNLPTDALIKLISSDKFSLAEEDVWRAVFRWAKCQANVQQPVVDWTESERRNVCKYLSSVISYVRLLLIDSKVFAEEIEPTGSIPMELSLERYRYAAVPQTFRHHDDTRLRPRIHTKRFHGTTILWKNGLKYQSTLNNWFGNSDQEWRLLYKATKDGFSAKTFHEKCDDFPNTFTIVQGHNGRICGGFSDVPWKNYKDNGKYSQSSSCFLFSLVNAEGFQPKRFDIVRPKYATLSHISLGPTFGAGPDLSIAHECNVNTESFSRLPHSYNGDNASHTSLMGNANFKVADYEVFVPKRSNKSE